jgi:hypothetical protein
MGQVDILYLHNVAESQGSLGPAALKARLAEAFGWLEAARAAGRIQVLSLLLYIYENPSCLYTTCKTRPLAEQAVFGGLKQCILALLHACMHAQGKNTL